MALSSDWIGNRALRLVPPSPALIAKGARFLDRMEQLRDLLAAPPVVAPAPAAVAPVATAHAERIRPLDPTAVLSPSSISGYMECSARWYYRKVLELPETRGAALGLGTAVHAGIAENFRQKIDSFEDMPVEGVTALFRNAMTEQLDTIVLDKTDSAADLQSCGEVMTRLYMERIAPRIQPAAVERHVSGLIGGVAVQGFIDVLDVNGDVIDLKTAKRKPSGVMPAYRLQVASYAMLEPQASGRARLDVMTKARTVDVVQQTVQVGEADRKYAAALYPIVQEQMRSGLVAPNRNSFLCSRKYCSHWERCIDTFGGEVA